MGEIIKGRLNAVILIMMIVVMRKERFQEHEFLAFPKPFLNNSFINNEIAFAYLKHNPNNLLLLPLI